MFAFRHIYSSLQKPLQNFKDLYRCVCSISPRPRELSDLVTQRAKAVALLGATKGPRVTKSLSSHRLQR